MESPCYYCPNRKANCHGVCEKYKKWRTQLDNLNAEKRKNHGWMTFVKER